jgi:eukaryotic-like serine/threonine-protein kinase
MYNRINFYIVFILILFCYIFSLANENWPMYLSDPQHTGFATDKINIPLHQKWSRTLSSQPLITVVDNNIVYVNTNNGYVYAFDAVDGSDKWNFNLMSSSSGLLVSGGIVYASNWLHELFAINAANGIQIWKVSFDDTFNNPILMNGILYTCGVSNGKVYAINTTDGSPAWISSARGGNYCSPAIENNILYATGNNLVYALNTTDGSLLWSYTVGAVIVDNVCVGDGAVYFGTGYGDFYAINTNGTIRWNYTPTYSHWWGHPIINNNKIFVGTSPDRVYVFNSQTGSVNWYYNTGSIVDSVAVTNNLLFTGSRDGLLRVFDHNSGSLVWSKSLVSPVSYPAVANKMFYITAGTYSNASIYAFEVPVLVEKCLWNINE